MSVLQKYVLTKHVMTSKSIYKIVHRSMVYKKVKNGWKNIDNENDLNGETYIMNRMDEFVEVEILDQNDDIEELRQRNEHISDKRIPLVKRLSLKTPPAALPKKIGKNKVKKKNDNNPASNADSMADKYFEMMDEGDDVTEDPDDSTIFHHSPSITPERHQASPLSRRDHNLQQKKIADSLANLGKLTEANSRKIEQVRRGSVTKEDLNEALERHAERMRVTNKENECHAEEPEFTADHKVKISNDFEMDYNLYYSAINAKRNSTRAKKVMAQFWPENVRLQLLVEYDKEKPNMRIVTDKEYLQLLDILAKLDKIQKIPVFQSIDRPHSNIRKWVSEWLRSSKYATKKIQNERRNETADDES